MKALLRKLEIPTSGNEEILKAKLSDYYESVYPVTLTNMNSEKLEDLLEIRKYIDLTVDRNLLSNSRKFYKSDYILNFYLFIIDNDFDMIINDRNIIKDFHYLFECVELKRFPEIFRFLLEKFNPDKIIDFYYLMEIHFSANNTSKNIETKIYKIYFDYIKENKIVTNLFETIEVNECYLEYHFIDVQKRIFRKLKDFKFFLKNQKKFDKEKINLYVHGLSESNGIEYLRCLLDFLTTRKIEFGEL